ncbi:ester cyclase [Streptomyces marokkonensis]|uniref:Ester cyclase n=1 Tax=Streptomyces marokkonensis TaxID=324855 RepID=A0ABW6QEI9_9ACTN|nr:ester cyclase [Streptomyces marokkonensis]
MNGRTATDAAVEEANKALARYWFQEGWNRGNVEVADRVFAPGFLLGGEPVGPEGPKRSVRARHAAFSGLTVDVGLQLADGPWVASWYAIRATHVGTFAGVPPTGLPVTSEGIQLWRVENGQVVEDRNIFDLWRVISQLKDGGAKEGDAIEFPKGRRG